MFYFYFINSFSLTNDEELSDDEARKDQVIILYEGLSILQLISAAQKKCLLLTKQLLLEGTSPKTPHAIKDFKSMASFIASQLLLKSLLETYIIQEWNILARLSNHEVQVLLHENRYSQALSIFLEKQSNKLPDFLYFAAFQDEVFTQQQFSSQHHYSSLAPLSLAALQSNPTIGRIVEESISESLNLWKEWMQWIHEASSHSKTEEPTYQDMITYIHIELAR